MPLAIVRVRMQRTVTGADPVYFSFGVDGALEDDTNGSILVADTMAGLGNAVGPTGSTQLVDMDADLVECFSATGGPAYYVESLDPVVPIGSGSAGSHIVQCAVNALVTTPRGVSPLGRMFVGPIAGTNAVSLTAAQRSLAVSIMQNVAQSHEASVFTPVVISKVQGGQPRPTPVGFPIIGWRADLTLDVLKSRRVPQEGTAVDYDLLPPA